MIEGKFITYKAVECKHRRIETLETENRMFKFQRSLVEQSWASFLNSPESKLFSSIK